jgi:glutamyl-tRNA synthetase
MSVTVRFAPSPTGRIHVGNVRTALINWLFARRSNGQFMLRLDDTDTVRSTQEFANGIVNDLEWLGLTHDIFARQSERFARYDEVSEKFKRENRLYACYETPDELDRKRKRQLSRGLPPVYDRAGLDLTEAQKHAFEAEGRTPHWRFFLEDRTMGWDDLVRGKQTIEASSLSDPILIRGDGTYLYTLPSVIDDVDFDVTHVIRGEDHVANTGAQIQVFEALGDHLPQFGHHNLLVASDGGRLSKRLGSLSVQGLREAGLEALSVTSFVATIGSSDPVAPFASMQALADNFDFAKLSRAPARFDERELLALNAKSLHEKSFDEVKSDLAALGVDGGEAFWLTVRGNIEKMKEAQDWWKIVEGPMTPKIEDPSFCAQAAALLPEGNWDENTWSQWTTAVKQETGAKGKGLFMPLRLALTGLDHGPELRALLPLIGRERALARLGG